MITQTDDGLFHFTAGRYALISSDWTGSLPDPRGEASPQAEITFTAELGAELTIIEREGMQMLVMPIGEDSRGATIRSIAAGPGSLVATSHLAIVALPEHDLGGRRSYPYASHLDQVVILDVSGTATVDPGSSAIDFCGFDGIQTIDLDAPGAFSIDGGLVDMIDDAAADAFGYGSDVFNAALDKHGFHVVLDPVRQRLRARTDHEGIALLARLDKLGFSVIAYYAPVAD